MTSNKRTRLRDSFAASQQSVLESIAFGLPLQEILEKIVALIEAQSAEMLCSIVLVTPDRRLTHAAGQRLPAEFIRGIEGLAIGPEVGSCGTAAFTRLPVVVDDISTHPAWREYRDLALSNGLRACWSTPILAPDGNVLATFAMYYREPRRPSIEEERWVQVATHLVTVAILSDHARVNDLERRRMEEAIRLGEHLRSVILDTVADAIFYVHVEGPGHYRMAAVNTAFSKLFGISDKDIVGRPLEDIVPPDMLERTLARYDCAARTGARQVWEEIMSSRAGEKFGEITLIPLFDAEGRCTNYVGTVHDMTARIQSERERAQLQSRLHQAQRIQALGTLAGGIAHDFNNILAAIGGNTDLLLEDIGADSPMRKPLLEIQKASRRANDLVRQILTFSRSSAPTYEIVDPRPVAAEALELLRATLPSDLELRESFAEDTPSIKADSTQFHQVVVNLVANAAHASGRERGAVEVLLDAATDAEIPRDTPAPIARGRYLRLRVRDQGCGMDAATLKRVFEPFFTTRPPGQGTGLGLSVVHGIVESHKGVIHIDSALGRGTVVSVFLPASEDAAKAPSAASHATGRGERIMYVDDEEALVLLMDRALTKRGYQVSGFSTPAEALKAFSDRPDDFEVVITDLSMPGMPGPQLASRLREVRKDVPIILTSGYIRPEDRDMATQLNINQVVYKSNTVDQLAEALGKEIEAIRAKR